MADLKTNTVNAWESTLSSALATGATTINVTDTTGSPAIPFYVVIDPGNDSKREVVLVDGAKTATTFTLSAATSRGQDGTSDVAHDSGAVIAIVPVAAMFNDLHERADAIKTTADAAYTPGGADVAVADGGTGASTAAAARTNLGAAAETHASTHSNGGTDEVTVENLGTAATDTSLVLKPNGTGGVNFAAGSATSALRATLSANQSISATTFTKVQFDTEAHDDIGEFDTATYRLTSVDGGLYVVSAFLAATLADGQRVVVSIYKNGAEHTRLDDRSAGVAAPGAAAGTATVKLAATDYIEVFVYSTAAETINGGAGADASRLTIAKVA